jgi:dipeptidyl aminopeptidase/acylaminoacyl peptidase
MKSRILPTVLLLAAVACGTAAGTSAADTPISITPELKGAWMPAEEPRDGRVVLMLHGFADDMDGAGDLTKHFAGDLAAHGIASARINFRGEGDRKRTVIESTFDTRIEDAEAAYAWLLRQPGVKPDHIGVLGWSLGAATEIEILGRHPGWFRTGAVWSSPCGDLEKVMLALPGSQQALKEGVTTQDAGWKKITTYRAFYLSFHRIDLDASLAKYPGPFLSVHGSLDFLADPGVEFMKAGRGQPAEAVTIGGADHIFSVFDPAKQHAGRLREITLGWFERTL